MTHPSFTLRRATDVLPSELRALYEAAGWWGPGDREEDLRAMLLGSTCALGAFEGERLVGFGRVLSDGCSDAYIQDVTVLPEARGRGVGTALVTALRDGCRDRGFGWVGLVAQPGTEAFYARLGFAVLPGHVAMRLAPVRA